MLIFQDTYSLKKNSIYLIIEILCNIINICSVFPDQFNASLMNKIKYIKKNNNNNILSF